MDLIRTLRVFVATAETGSFTAAARRLGISNRLTSKDLADLEARLGTRLFQRTTRKLGLTPAGAELLARAPAVIEEVDDMLGAIREDSQGFSGVLRISAPVTFGEIYLARMLSRFAAPHPDLTIDLRLDDAYADLAGEGIDLAFRIGTPDSFALRQRRIGAIRSVVVASPGYLSDHPAPVRPEDLLAHDCILDSNRRDAGRWIFLRDGAEQAVEVRSRFHVNSARAARDLALAGLGIAFCPRFVLGDALETGRLIAVLDAVERPAHPLGIVYLEGRTLPRKVRALIDFAVEDIRRSGAVTGLRTADDLT
ncbi:LysR family transcriptional regulator [Celeribacter indicus]|uniref:LysR family transcriptional regulator n=1 Tax=Celeribacter indicus TaxID=1208324 RepID=A0A0B5DNS1_9RHOB|nr:LysR family transcriptional regulator [Celeribacter indicus]AJE45223.1 LysR family transcriptional regulator [Celeribacter indicus]SDX45652.1 transcriptional regulator, LysR family [Celeribacter indicus]